MDDLKLAQKLFRAECELATRELSELSVCQELSAEEVASVAGGYMVIGEGPDYYG